MKLLSVGEYKKEINSTNDYIVKLSPEEIDTIILALDRFVDIEYGSVPHNQITSAEILSDTFSNIIDENE